ncbi:flagellar biosynthesis protein FlgA [Candidatus Termititenax persephonae]|uniref:Flagella basal body P-ring formation protein FlgA n=1 Tax=Candidatus Termititenax persephonae TaxID=2218525 RepID=A0A388TFM7_9BACT|nr:flagellar biosynthesis protein FlgA [Candidatus Termititenax persephonae]
MRVGIFFWIALLAAQFVGAAEILPHELLSLGLAELRTVPRFVDKEVTLNFYKVPDPIFVPTDNYTIRTKISAKEVTPVLYIEYEVYEDQTFLKGFRLRYNAAVYAEAYYAKRRLGKGTEVSAEDFYTARTDVLRYSRCVVAPYTDWDGHVLAIDLAQDEPLYASMLGAKQLVNAGDIITLVVISDTVTIKAKAKALQPGLLGDKIRVQMQNEKKRLLQAEITAPGECRITLD